MSVITYIFGSLFVSPQCQNTSCPCMKSTAHPRSRARWFSAWAHFRTGLRKSVQIISRGIVAPLTSHPNLTCPSSMTTRPSTKRSTLRFRRLQKGKQMLLDAGVSSCVIEVHFFVLCWFY